MNLVQIVQRRDFLRAHSNYLSKTLFIHEKLTLNLFVNYEKLDLQGNPLQDLNSPKR